MTAAQAPVEELPPMVFNMVVAAVNIARNDQVRTVAALRLKLSQTYPEVDPAHIDAALRLWSQRVRDTEAHLRC